MSSHVMDEDPQMAESQMADPQMADPQMADPQMAESQMADPQMADPQMAESQMADPQMADPQMAESQMADPQMADPQMAESQIVPRYRLSGKECRLCACTIGIDEEAVPIFQSTPTKPAENDKGIVTLADQINEALPILVSKEDELPKQVCFSCVEMLKLFHSFTVQVREADEHFKKRVYQSSEIELNTDEDVGIQVQPDAECPRSLEGTMVVVDGTARAPPEKEPETKKKRPGRPKGSTEKRSCPWEDDADTDWTTRGPQKKKGARKPGRPKGSKNSKTPKKIVSTTNNAVNQDDDPHRRNPPGRPKGSKNRSAEQGKPMQHSDDRAEETMTKEASAPPVNSGGHQHG